MKYLIKTVEQYRVDSEAEAKKLIEDAKLDKGYTLSKYSSEYKCAKAKGEIVDEWFRVILTKEFNAEKEPYCTVDVTYDVEMGTFPEPVETTEEDGGIEF
jgi:hypothetical protein